MLLAWDDLGIDLGIVSAQIEVSAEAMALILNLAVILDSPAYWVDWDAHSDEIQALLADMQKAIQDVL